MNKIVCGIVGGLLVVSAAMADTMTATVSVTNGQPATLSGAIPVSGWLDKIEIVQSGGTGSTSAVVVATYSGTTAVDTFATKTLAAASQIFRPRVVGTANTGTALAAAATGTNDYTAGTVLAAPYERILIGGNVKLSVAGTNVKNTNTVTATIYYEPLKK